MKKTWKILAMVAVLACAALAVGCGKSASADTQSTATVVGTDFEVIQTLDPSRSIIVSLVPASGSVPGDGYWITGDYFLPDGQELVLSNDKHCKIGFSRLFKTSRGYFVGENHSIDINPDKPEDMSYSANLQKIPDNSIAGWIFPPRIIADFKNAKIVVSEAVPYGPPQHADEIELQYRAFIRTGRLPISFFAAPQSGRAAFELPAESAYGEAIARTRIIDTDNNRIITSNSSNMIEFE